jgi:TonB family protein
MIRAASGVTMELRFSRHIISRSRLVFVLVAIPAAPFAQGQASPPAMAALPRRVKVAEDVTSALLIQKAAIQYPDAARKAGTQGTVVLNVVTSDAVDVKEVTVSSEDSTLAQAALDSVKQWKYKPYVVGLWISGEYR